ncbi:MAG: hypothetical protein M1118_00185 [Chloroflexi bacterium]|nr:hypothetical protein [Chloroflexota bacterium]
MTFDWRSYLQLAQFLQGQGGANCPQEAAERSAVSRAYYAAYGHARTYACQHLAFAASGRPEDHKRLQQHFQNQGQVRIAKDLSRLRQWRNDCDYEDSVPHLVQCVKQSVNYAVRVIDTLK